MKKYSKTCLGEGLGHCFGFRKNYFILEKNIELERHRVWGPINLFSGSSPRTVPQGQYLYTDSFPGQFPANDSQPEKKPTLTLPPRQFIPNPLKNPQTHLSRLSLSFVNLHGWMLTTQLSKHNLYVRKSHWLLSKVFRVFITLSLLRWMFWRQERAKLTKVSHFFYTLQSNL